MIGNRMKPIELFFSYSHKDEELRDELLKHLSLLKREGVIAGWHDREISADLILLLVSSDFIRFRPKLFENKEVLRPILTQCGPKGLFLLV